MLKKIFNYLLSFFRSREFKASVHLEDYRLVTMDKILFKELITMSPGMRVNMDTVKALKSIGALSTAEEGTTSIYKVDLFLERAIILIVLNTKGNIFLIKIDKCEKYPEVDYRILTISDVYILGRYELLNMNEVLESENPANTISIKNNRYFYVKNTSMGDVDILFTIITRTIETFKCVNRNNTTKAEHEIETRYTTIMVANSKLEIANLDNDYNTVVQQDCSNRAFDCYLNLKNRE